MHLESENKRIPIFLKTSCRISKEAISSYQQKCKSIHRDKEKTKAYFDFINWKETEKEVALFTMYAPASFKVPKIFDCIFDYDNLEVAYKSKITLTQSIVEGFYPRDSFEEGYKHLGVFKFEDEIHNLILKLHSEKGRFSSLPKDYLTLGICQMEDYQHIKKQLISNR